MRENDLMTNIDSILFNISADIKTICKYSAVFYFLNNLSLKNDKKVNKIPSF